MNLTFTVDHRRSYKDSDNNWTILHIMMYDTEFIDMEFEK